MTVMIGALNSFGGNVRSRYATLASGHAKLVLFLLQTPHDTRTHTKKETQP